MATASTDHALQIDLIVSWVPLLNIAGCTESATDEVFHYLYHYSDLFPGMAHPGLFL